MNRLMLMIYVRIIITSHIRETNVRRISYNSDSMLCTLLRYLTIIASTSLPSFRCKINDLGSAYHISKCHNANYYFP